MTKNEFYPLRRGYNDCLGVYEKRDDTNFTRKRNRIGNEVDVPNGNRIIIESHIPIQQQYSLNFDMF